MICPQRARKGEEQPLLWHQQGSQISTYSSRYRRGNRRRARQIVCLGTPLVISCVVILFPWTTCYAKPFWLFGKSSNANPTHGETDSDRHPRTQILSKFQRSKYKIHEQNRKSGNHYREQENEANSQLPARYDSNQSNNGDDDVTSLLYASQAVDDNLTSSIYHHYCSGFASTSGVDSKDHNEKVSTSDQLPSSSPLRNWGLLLTTRLSGGGNRGNRRSSTKSKDSNESINNNNNANGTASNATTNATSSENDEVSKFNETQLFNATKSSKVIEKGSPSESLLFMLLSKSKLFEGQQQLLSKFILKFQRVSHALQTQIRENGGGINGILTSLTELSWQDLKDPLMNTLPTILSIMFLIRCWDIKTVPTAVNESGGAVADGVVGGSLAKGLEQRLSYTTLYGLALLGASCGFYLFLYFITVGYALGITLPVISSLLFYHSKVRSKVIISTQLMVAGIPNQPLDSQTKSIAVSLFSYELESRWTYSSEKPNSHPFIVDSFMGNPYSDLPIVERIYQLACITFKGCRIAIQDGYSVSFQSVMLASIFVLVCGDDDAMLDST